MSIETQRSYLETRMTNVAPLAVPIPALWFDNIPFDPNPSGKHVVFTVLHGDARPADIGKKTVDRHVGVIQIDVLVPENKGTVDANNLAEYFGNAFRKLDIVLSDGARLVTKVPAFKNLGTRNNFFRIAVSIPFYRDEKRA